MFKQRIETHRNYPVLSTTINCNCIAFISTEIYCFGQQDRNGDN